MAPYHAPITNGTIEPAWTAAQVADEHGNGGDQPTLHFAHPEREGEQHELPFTRPGHHRIAGPIHDQKSEVSTATMNRCERH